MNEDYASQVNPNLYNLANCSIVHDSNDPSFDLANVKVGDLVVEGDEVKMVDSAGNLVTTTKLTSLVSTNCDSVLRVNESCGISLHKRFEQFDQFEPRIDSVIEEIKKKMTYNLNPITKATFEGYIKGLELAKKLFNDD